MLKFFAEKMWVAFAATHIFFSKKYQNIVYWIRKTVNEMTLNELVKLMTLWTTGPWYRLLSYTSSYKAADFTLAYYRLIMA